MAEDSPAPEISSISLGFVMPIAKTDGYNETHWSDVYEILESIADEIGIKTRRIVSDGDTVTTIHSRIVNNLYSDDIIICDVSSRNPNVMFELGMRIAFDKPVIIIKDNATDYCFDSGTIEHIPYPKDLRYAEINQFRTKLSRKIKSTYEAFIKIKSTESPILKNFGSFEKAKIDIEELSTQESLVQDISIIKNTITKLQMLILPQSKNDYSRTVDFNGVVRNKMISEYDITNLDEKSRDVIRNFLDKLNKEYILLGNTLSYRFDSPSDRKNMDELIKGLLPK